MNPRVILAAAQAAHAANCAYCMAIGDPIPPKWEDLGEELRASLQKGVEGVIAGNTPEQQHASWMETRLADGWKYGPVKNAELKEHPNLVPYAALPETQQAKDEIFNAVVRSVLRLHESFATLAEETPADGDQADPQTPTPETQGDPVEGQGGGAP